MKTIFIYDTLGQGDIRFFVKYGDYSHLNNTYINDSNADKAKIDELNAIMFSEDFQKDMVDFVENFPYADATGEYRVVVVGFLP